MDMASDLSRFGSIVRKDGEAERRHLDGERLLFDTHHSVRKQINLGTFGTRGGKRDVAFHVGAIDDNNHLLVLIAPAEDQRAVRIVSFNQARIAAL
jgi:hypothetical protein